MSLKGKLSRPKPWAKLNMSRKEWDRTKPWKKADCSKNEFTEIVLAVDQATLDAIREEAQADILMQQIFGHTGD